jgi:hypothetical protein
LNDVLQIVVELPVIRRDSNVVVREIEVKESDKHPKEKSQPLRIGFRDLA